MIYWYAMYDVMHVPAVRQYYHTGGQLGPVSLEQSAQRCPKAQAEYRKA